MTKEEMIKSLNEDLAGELGAIIQYLNVCGEGYRPLQAATGTVFLGEVADEQMHAQYLANKIVALGGEPTTTARPVPVAATNKEMVEQVLAAEQQATKDYTARAKQAEDLGDKGLAVQLEDMVRDESAHSEETERLLRDWPL